MNYATEQEAIAAGEQRLDDEGIIDFDGMNCNDYLSDGDDECPGWTGDRRCVCGNRRVSWSTSQNDDGTWYAYAEAY